MTTKKIISVVEMYEKRLKAENIPKKRIDPSCAFGSVGTGALLAHTHFLVDGVKQYAQNPEKRRKAGSHLTAVQMCLSFAGWYTLEDIMNHNRPAENK